MNIDNDLLKDIYQLKNIIRYNTRPRLKDESVAEHSFYVALLSLIICKQENLDEHTTFEALVKAILHDMPEIEINDITHDVKERLHLKEFLKQYEDEYYHRRFPAYASLMSDETSTSQYVLETADALSVVQYVNNEMYLGNKSETMTEIVTEAANRVNKSYEKLKQSKEIKDEENK